MRTRNQTTLGMLFVLAMALAGCGSTGGPSAGGTPTIEPNGEYRFTYEDRGDESTGVATIVGTPGAHSGTVHFDDGRPDVPISAAAASGNLMIITADVPGAVLLLRLRFDGDAFTGDWTMGRGAGPISGTRTGAER